MKGLKEALLNRPKNINVAQLVAEEYINTNYTIKGKLSFENVNGVCVVNCDGDVYVKNQKIEKLTDGFVWGEVKGDFYCSNCKNLTSLEGAPKEIGVSFSCASCRNLETLKGSPKSVGSNFHCSGCTNLKSLEGAPKEVGRDFYCFYCSSLNSLKGAPEKVGRYFDCSECHSLKTLEGAPKKVKKIVCDDRLKQIKIHEKSKRSTVK